MNNFHVEDLLEIANQRNQDEVVSQLNQKAVKNSVPNRWLVALGSWMVAMGKKMQSRSTSSLQAKHLTISHSKAKKARA